MGIVMGDSVDWWALSGKMGSANVSEYCAKGLRRGDSIRGVTGHHRMFKWFGDASECGIWGEVFGQCVH
jgi:hypothetical protein